MYVVNVVYLTTSPRMQCYVESGSVPVKSCYTKNQVKENSHAKPEQVSFLFKCAKHSFQRYNRSL